MSDKLQGASLKSLIINHLDDYKLDHPVSTIKNQRNLLGRFLRWLEDRELTPKECRAYVKYMQVEKGLCWNSVSSDTRRLKTFIGWLYTKANDGDGVIDRDWAKEIHSPRQYGGGR